MIVRENELYHYGVKGMKWGHHRYSYNENVSSRKRAMKDAKKYIIENSYDSRYGARPIKRYVSKNIESLLANNIIEDNISFGQSITIDIDNNEFIIK